MEKTLLDYCKPPGRVLDKTRRGNIFDLNDLIENNIDRRRSFDENFPIQEMNASMDTTFKHFHRKRSMVVVKQTQSMGDGR